MSAVELVGITKSYGDGAVVDDVSLSLPDGSLTVLVGPSGCGKSTTLRILAGLESADSGTVHIGDRDVTAATPRQRDVAMVFQNYALYPQLSVAGNIAFPLRNAGVAKDVAAQRAHEAAERVGITKLLDRKPRQLSGGQQQRVAIARALVRTPSVFLFDEPLSNLDAKLRVELRSEIRRLQQELGITALYVTHDQEEAMTIADQLVVLNAGRIEQRGTPHDLYRTPANTFVAGFIGSPTANLIRGRIDGGSFEAEGIRWDRHRSRSAGRHRRGATRGRAGATGRRRCWALRTGRIARSPIRLHHHARRAATDRRRGGCRGGALGTTAGTR